MRKERDEILRAATTFFRRGAFRPPTMGEVAEAIGVNRSALYYHFGGKGNILFEILMAGVTESISKVDEISRYPLSASDRLKLMIRAILHLYSEDPAMPVVVIFRESSGLTEEQRRRYIEKRDEYETIIRQLIEEGIESGEFRRVNVKVFVFGMLGMLWEFPSWYRAEGSLSIDEVADIYSDMVLTGLSNDKPKGPNIEAPKAQVKQAARSSSSRKSRVRS